MARSLWTALAYGLIAPLFAGAIIFVYAEVVGAFMEMVGNLMGSFFSAYFFAPTVFAPIGFLVGMGAAAPIRIQRDARISARLGLIGGALAGYFWCTTDPGATVWATIAIGGLAFALASALCAVIVGMSRQDRLEDPERS